jgi:hypothetical protein
MGTQQHGEQPEDRGNRSGAAIGKAMAALAVSALQDLANVVRANASRHLVIDDIIRYLETGKTQTPLQQAKMAVPQFLRPYILALETPKGTEYLTIDSLERVGPFVPWRPQDEEVNLRARVASEPLEPLINSQKETAEAESAALVYFTFSNSKGVGDNLVELAESVVQAELDAKQARTSSREHGYLSREGDRALL